MQIALITRTGRGRRVKRAGVKAAQTLSVASQMALLCPSGMDTWMRHELASCFELPRDGKAAGR